MMIMTHTFLYKFGNPAKPTDPIGWLSDALRQYARQQEAKKQAANGTALATES